MQEQLEQLKQQALKEIKAITDSSQFEAIRQKYFSRTSGELAKLLKDISTVAEEMRPTVGAFANKVKADVESALGEKMKELGATLRADAKGSSWIDVTRDIDRYRLGHLHPLTQIQYELEDLFSSMGFAILDGPELESDYYNFEALNIPSWHPAREAQDTFYVEHTGSEKLVLRTHTSPVQVRAMQTYGAPFRAVVPGRVFRNEATDASHEHTFYQMEGLMVDSGLSIAHLIGVMKELLRGIFKREVDVRLRPGFFPFVEPGFELDIRCMICAGAGCSVCKRSGWVELMPCGMVHPRVLEYGNIDPKKYTGFAFGLGLTRLVMMRYGIDDIRLLQNPDVRFLNQF